MPITNPQLKSYDFLKELRENEFFPDFMVKKGINILTDLCVKIETEKPSSKKEVASLVYAATEKFNDLQAELDNGPSPEDAITRHIIDANYDVILDAYGYDFDVEDLFPAQGWQ